MTAKKPKLILPLLLLAASVLAVYPAMTLEKPQQASGAVTLDADGQAFINNNGKPKNTNKALSATLTLSGSVRTEGNEELKLEGLSGTLSIGSTNYTITGGKGEVSKKGKVEINAKTGDANRKLELVLHGSIQGKNVLFNSPESKLSSLYFLSLKGEAAVIIGPTSTTATSDGGKTATVTATQYNTVTGTVTTTQENTVTTTETVNQTFTEIVTETVTETATVTGTNSTVTVTETLTTTVANSTITVTETVPSTTSPAT
jgi:hypothetical protein